MNKNRIRKEANAKRNAYMKAYYKQHKERIRKQRKAWRRKNRDRLLERQRLLYRKNKRETAQKIRVIGTYNLLIREASCG